MTAQCRLGLTSDLTSATSDQFTSSEKRCRVFKVLVLFRTLVVGYCNTRSSSTVWMINQNVTAVSGSQD